MKWGFFVVILVIVISKIITSRSQAFIYLNSNETIFNNIFILFGISVCLSIIIYIVVLFSDYLKVDLFYNNFTSIHQGSIIAGTSRGRYAF